MSRRSPPWRGHLSGMARPSPTPCPWSFCGRIERVRGQALPGAPRYTRPVVLDGDSGSRHARKRRADFVAVSVAVAFGISSRRSAQRPAGTRLRLGVPFAFHGFTAGRRVRLGYHAGHEVHAGRRCGGPSALVRGRNAEVVQHRRMSSSRAPGAISSGGVRVFGHGRPILSASRVQVWLDACSIIVRSRLALEAGTLSRKAAPALRISMAPAGCRTCRPRPNPRARASRDGRTCCAGRSLLCRGWQRREHHQQPTVRVRALTAGVRIRSARGGSCRVP